MKTLVLLPKKPGLSNLGATDVDLKFDKTSSCLISVPPWLVFLIQSGVTIWLQKIKEYL